MFLHPDTPVQLVSNQSSSVLGEETIVLQYEAGMYYELNEMGGFIWSLLQANKGMTVGQIREKLLDEFEVDAVVCQQELVQFLDDLLREKLIETTAPVP
ncbi:PqqD family peptide modification chaperone [Spirosoma sp. 209]|uniref:PqqD family peptide modification chaperone n=1 Tax=Spirosoma sp. 209 TaxID=1955701 RepID=UPI00098D0EAD|nr:PqqD family peptide modification chaperone [Spirosoma sp. 209]